jgi:hypothetical protein
MKRMAFGAAGEMKGCFEGGDCSVSRTSIELRCKYGVSRDEQKD